MNKLNELKARLNEIAERLDEINREYDGKRFSEDAKTEWNALHQEREDVRATVKELEVRMRQLEDAAEDAANLEPGDDRNRGGSRRSKHVNNIPDNIWDLAEYRHRSTSAEGETRLLRDGAMRAIEQATFKHERANIEDSQEHIAKMLDRLAAGDDGEMAKRILVTGSPIYERAFAKQLVGAPLTSDEARALSLGGTAAYAVPFTLDPTIVPTTNGAVNPLREMSRVETISNQQWKGVTSGGVTASFVAAGTEASDGSPTLTQPEITPERAQSFVAYDIEVGQDWGGLLSELAREFQDAKDDVEATKFLTGAGHGSNEPKGLLTAATATVAAGTAAFAIGHLYALQEALAPRWEPNASFLAHNAQYNRVRQFDTAGGANLWEYLANETPDRLLGYRAYKHSKMASVLTASSKIMTFGDFSKFVIVDRVGMSVELIPHLFGTAANLPTGQRGALAVWRTSSDVLTTAAFKTLVTT